VKCVAPELPPGCPEDCWSRYWPAIELMPGAMAVVGGGGYNTVYESLACGAPLVCRPWPRMYDRQELRSQRAAAVVKEPEEAARAALACLRTGPRRAPEFVNGAEEAVALIRAHVQATGTLLRSRVSS
jgi:hypothetical protein